MKNKFSVVLLAISFVFVGIAGQAFADDAAEAKLNAKTETQMVNILSIEADKKNDADNSINNRHAKFWGKAGGQTLGLAAAAGAGVGASFIPGAGPSVGAIVAGLAAPAATQAGGKLGEKAGNATAPEKVTVEAVKMTYQLPDVCKDKHGKEVCNHGKIKTEQFVAHLCDYKLGQATMIMDAKGKGRVQPNATCQAPKKSKKGKASKKLNPQK